MAEYKKEFELSIKQKEYEIKKILQAIEKGYEERMRKIDNAQKICENNVIEVKKLCNVLNNFENKNKVFIANLNKIVERCVMK